VYLIFEYMERNLLNLLEQYETGLPVSSEVYSARHDCQGHVPTVHGAGGYAPA